MGATASGPPFAPLNAPPCGDPLAAGRRGSVYTLDASPAPGAATAWVRRDTASAEEAIRTTPGVVALHWGTDARLYQMSAADATSAVPAGVYVFAAAGETEDLPARIPWRMVQIVSSLAGRGAVCNACERRPADYALPPWCRQGHRNFCAYCLRCAPYYVVPTCPAPKCRSHLHGLHEAPTERSLRPYRIAPVPAPAPG